MHIFKNVSDLLKVRCLRPLTVSFKTKYLKKYMLGIFRFSKTHFTHFLKLNFKGEKNEWLEKLEKRQMHVKTMLSGNADVVGGAALAAKVAHVDGKIWRHVKPRMNRATPDAIVANYRIFDT